MTSLSEVITRALILSGVANALASSGQTAGRLSPTALDRLLMADGRLSFPTNYREWIFLSSGNGMSYSTANTDSRPLPFDNVFVDPAAYRAFVRTGTWPEGTVFALEIRPGRSEGSINKRGSFQRGEPNAVEVHTKDARFPTGWAFYAFDAKGPATRIPETAECYSCHQANGAVQTTFVQFYPTLLPIAVSKNTLSPAYVRVEAAAAKN